MLISPKLQVPPLRAMMLPREHLVDRLNAGRDSRLLLVTGSAGSGKTSIVCQWLKKEKISAAWYSLDEADNDPDLFLRYFLTALGRLDERFGLAMTPLLEGQKRLVGSEISPYFAQHLVGLPEDVYFVLDDYHLITSREIHDIFTYLLHQALPKVHIIIISRRSMPFPVSKLKVRGQMVEISDEEMKFTYRGTERFFREILPVKLSEGQIRELNNHMEGWVGGLQLFGLALRGKKTVDTLSGILSRASEEAADFLIDEVVNTQPERVRRFLYASALLERFNGALCREVTGSPDACETLELVFRNNLFLIPLDSEGKWYRYHHLFSKAVRKRARASSEEACRRICRTAALWFARNGYLEDAFRHAFASEDTEFAADMLEDYLMVLYERHEIASFRRWMHKLPREVFAKRGLLRLYECRFKMESVQLSDVPAAVRDMEGRWTEVVERYEGAKRKLCEDLLLLFKRILPYWFDPENVDVKNLEDAIRQISPENRALSAFAITIPFSYFYKGRMPLAAEALNEASAGIFSSGSRLAMMIWFRVAATVERFRGRLCRSEAVLKEAFLFLERCYLPKARLGFMLDLQMAWILYMRGDLEGALEHGLGVLRYVEQTRFLYEIVDVNYLLSLIFEDRGETGKADRCVQRMQRAARAIGTLSLIALTDAYVARLFVARGDIRQAESWRNRRNLSLAEPFSLRFVPECLAHAEILSAQGNGREALPLLETLRDRCVGQDMMEAVLDIDLLRSANLFSLGDRRTARTIMNEAIRMSEPEGYVRPFVYRAPAISPVLMDIAAMRSRVAESSYLDTIMTACGIRRGAVCDLNGSRYERVANLTRREIEIMELMSAGYRDKEMAEKLFISLHTVRTHTKHILEKLDVKTRVRAIRRVEELKARQHR